MRTTTNQQSTQQPTQQPIQQPIQQPAKREVTTMTTSVLDPTDRRLEQAGAVSGLGRLHDEAASYDETRLPCRVADPELWFAEAPSELEAAKALCGDCPVREMCLSGALDRREPWGVWGGELFLQGAVIARKRPRGRPRKNDTAAA